MSSGGGYGFDDAERDLLARAEHDLPALTVARHATQALATVIEGSHVPPEPDAAPPSYYARLASLMLSVIGLRTARACMLVVSAGYMPESHGLKRRLSEVHARGQAIASDTSGQHARDWLAGKGPSTPPRIVGKFGSADLWDMYSMSAHADARSVHQWLSVPMPQVRGADTGLVVIPHHQERLSNALLTEVAMECRDLYAAQAVAREMNRERIVKWHARLPDLDAEIEPMLKRYYAPEPDA